MEEGNMANPFGAENASEAQTSSEQKPEQIVAPVSQAAEVKYAGFWIRLLATIIDLFLPGIVGVILGFVVLYISPKSTGSIYLTITKLIIIWVYYIWMTNKYQATLGKMIFGLGVQNNEGKKVTLGKIVLRETIGKILSWITLSIGFIMAGFTRRKQALHDKIAGTVVVYKDSGFQSYSGLVLGGFILGIFSFIPGLGLFIGVLAIIFSAIAFLDAKKNKKPGRRIAIAGIILGILGIMFTIALYSSLYYFGFKAKSGPFTDIKIETTKTILQNTAGSLELYKKEHGNYPASIKDLQSDNKSVFGEDFYQQPLYYKVSGDGQSYELRSIGPDGQYGTVDDIIFGK
ncbi:MAG TPA: RDD family protein [Patescibacteria group bacterium]